MAHLNRADLGHNLKKGLKTTRPAGQTLTHLRISTANAQHFCENLGFEKRQGGAIDIARINQCPENDRRTNLL